MESGSASSSSSPHRTADLRSRIPGLTVCTLTMREVSSHRYQRTDCSVKLAGARLTTTIAAAGMTAANGWLLYAVCR
ncbi:Hypothetical protein SMAX5B_010657 [Scophthalmus maximus]|uniref:Uncharacterized protein n=1 Tax=Scophthalmus maximus TaxID=52904 RepID=A0A2U9B0U7_SCOMX|nr:Hypothetical protein SMAX5B_010657 [Scophthalmus maximus]